MHYISSNRASFCLLLPERFPWLPPWQKPAQKKIKWMLQMSNISMWLMTEQTPKNMNEACISSSLRAFVRILLGNQTSTYTYSSYSFYETDTPLNKERRSRPTSTPVITHMSFGSLQISIFIEPPPHSPFSIILGSTSDFLRQLH